MFIVAGGSINRSAISQNSVLQIFEFKTTQMAAMMMVKSRRGPQHRLEQCRHLFYCYNVIYSLLKAFNQSYFNLAGYYRFFGYCRGCHATLSVRIKPICKWQNSTAVTSLLSLWGLAVSHSAASCCDEE